jgi:hypothetical protein
LGQFDQGRLVQLHEKETLPIFQAEAGRLWIFDLHLAVQLPGQEHKRPATKKQRSQVDCLF